MIEWKRTLATETDYLSNFLLIRDDLPIIKSPMMIL